MSEEHPRKRVRLFPFSKRTEPELEPYEAPTQDAAADQKTDRQCESVTPTRDSTLPSTRHATYPQVIDSSSPIVPEYRAPACDYSDDNIARRNDKSQRGGSRFYQKSKHFEFLEGKFYGGQTFNYETPKNQTSVILEWISTVPVISHHKRISDSRLEGTAEWIFEKKEYRNWKSSTVSTLLLLPGIPGAGKTYIASRVIDEFLSNQSPDSTVAFFYCNRAEEIRRDPQNILSALVQQLSLGSGDKLLKPVFEVYKERERIGQTCSPLSLAESWQLLIDLTDLCPQTTICLDALDEIEDERRVDVLKVLREVATKSRRLVRIFATTRMDQRILLQLEIFPRIILRPDDNFDDIILFVEENLKSAINDGRLLHGAVPDGLKTVIRDSLCTRSKGMFQLAALQIRYLCCMLTQADVRSSLTALPETLTAAYDDIYARILAQKGSAPQLALNAFRWVQCSYKPLHSKILLDASTAMLDHSGSFSPDVTVRANDLLAACQNLLIFDERLDVFRFAHLSVDEYLETRLPKFGSHAEIAKMCLSILCSPMCWDDYRKPCLPHVSYEDIGEYDLLGYATVFWPWHFVRCEEGKGCQTLTSLWNTFISDSNYLRWVRSLEVYTPLGWEYWFSYQGFFKQLERWQQGNKHLLSTALEFGLGRQFTILLESDRHLERNLLNGLLLRTSSLGDIHLYNTKLLIERGAEICHVDAYRRTPLHIALRRGNDTIVRLLVELGANVTAADGSGITPLHIASEYGHNETALLLIEQGADVSAAGGSGITPLHVASECGRNAIARLLVEQGADISAADGTGKTPLHIASKYGHNEIALLLIGQGADLSAADGSGITPLHIALRRRNHSIVRLLIERGADVSAVDDSGITPLHISSESRRNAIARLLIEQGADVSAADGTGITPLHIASEYGHNETALLLIEQGADLSAADRSGKTPLHIASEYGHNETALLLIEKGADISVAGDSGITPLHSASRSGNDTIVRLLIGQGADVSAAYDSGITPLHIASECGHIAIALLLIEQGADVSAANGTGITPLHMASEYGHNVIARLLIEQGTDVSAADVSGITPLYVALVYGHNAISRLLIEQGADVSVADGFGISPSHIALRRKHKAIARLLIERGADVSEADDTGITPLHIALRDKREAIARLLIEQEADVSAVDGTGITPLHIASEYGLDAIALMLIEQGADLSAADGSGITPLHIASERGHKATVQLLVEQGADVSAVDNFGETPLDVASKWGQEEVVRLLLGLSANICAAAGSERNRCCAILDARRRSNSTAVGRTRKRVSPVDNLADVSLL